MSAGGDGALWVFGYGSLVWRPDFASDEQRPGWIEGWRRVFWQGSTDHRGVPGAPGRVVTLVPHASSRCWGMAYRVPDGLTDEVLARLDHREKGGYERKRVRIHFRDRSGAHGLTWIATSANENWLGPAPLADIARQAASARGPSGDNVEYVVRLATALREIGARDPHVEKLAELLRGS